MSPDFAAAGLGLPYGSVRLARAHDGWALVASGLVDAARGALAEVATAVEHIGSTSVPGMLAKPIIDLAIGTRPGVVVGDVTGLLDQLGWIYRGDAGDEGGWVFVLQDAPWHRVAHAHGVEFGGEQWLRYIAFRELLRRSPQARRAYEKQKQHLAQKHPDGRADYTSGKGTIVQELLATER